MEKCISNNGMIIHSVYICLGLLQNVSEMTLRVFFLCSLGGAGAEERIQSAELLDDSISEAPGC